MRPRSVASLALGPASLAIMLGLAPSCSDDAALPARALTAGGGGASGGGAGGVGGTSGAGDAGRGGGGGGDPCAGLSERGTTRFFAVQTRVEPAHFATYAAFREH
ncbi:MAG TPA: hypothetical protein VFS00_17705, partial [Polyangiaceae bacterium]|nr:hypothetical protein [Polyangiaceae bacterium]